MSRSMTSGSVMAGVGKSLSLDAEGFGWRSSCSMYSVSYQNTKVWVRNVQKIHIYIYIEIWTHNK